MYLREAVLEAQRSLLALALGFRRARAESMGR